MPADRWHASLGSLIGPAAGKYGHANRKLVLFNASLHQLRVQDRLPPSFFLYGEPVRSADPEFVHVESLATRSKPSEWNIAPHRHDDLSHMIVISRGGGTIRYECETMHFCAPRLLIVPAQVVHGFHWHADSDGMVLTIAEIHLLQLVARHRDFAGLFDRPRSIALTPSECTGLSEEMAAMGEELSWGAFGRSAAIEAGLLKLFVHGVRQIDRQSRSAQTPPRHSGLLARYRQLVEKRFRLRESVESYARQLGVSTTTLRQTCAAIGQSPSEIRDQRAVLEAQRLLAYSAEPVAEIGLAIGMPDPAYFSRFFSRKCGAPPAAWRKAVKRNQLGDPVKDIRRPAKH